MKTTDENQPKQWKQWTVIVPIAGHVVMTVTAMAAVRRRGMGVGPRPVRVMAVRVVAVMAVVVVRHGGRGVPNRIPGPEHKPEPAAGPTTFSHGAKPPIRYRR